MAVWGCLELAWGERYCSGHGGDRAVLPRSRDDARRDSGAHWARMAVPLLALGRTGSVSPWLPRRPRPADWPAAAADPPSSSSARRESGRDRSGSAPRWDRRGERHEATSVLDRVSARRPSSGNAHLTRARRAPAGSGRRHKPSARRPGAASRCPRWHGSSHREGADGLASFPRWRRPGNGRRRSGPVPRCRRRSRPEGPGSRRQARVG